MHPAQPLKGASDLLSDFYSFAHQTFNKLMAEEGLSLAKTKMLRGIANDDGIRQKELAEVLGLASNSVTAGVDCLVRIGLVERVQEVFDRRVKRLYLTEKGTQILRSSELARRQFERDLFDCLQEKEIEQLVELISKLNCRLSSLEFLLREA